MERIASALTFVEPISEHRVGVGERQAESGVDEAPHQSWPTGISRNACPRDSTSSTLTPGGTPVPEISPRSLMCSANARCNGELGGIKVFRSIMGPPFSQKNALIWLGTRLTLDAPTT